LLLEILTQQQAPKGGVALTQIRNAATITAATASALLRLVKPIAWLSLPMAATPAPNSRGTLCQRLRPLAARGWRRFAFAAA